MTGPDRPTPDSAPQPNPFAWRAPFRDRLSRSRVLFVPNSDRVLFYLARLGFVRAYPSAQQACARHFRSRFQLGNISLFLFFFLAIMFLHPLTVSFLAPERKS